MRLLFWRHRREPPPLDNQTTPDQALAQSRRDLADSRRDHDAAKRQAKTVKSTGDKLREIQKVPKDRLAEAIERALRGNGA